MINNIIDGIAVKLHQIEPDYTLYKEEIPQGFDEPCFSILHIQSSNAGKLPVRYLRRNAFDIHFFPDTKSANQKEEMYRIGEALFLALEHIKVLDNLARGTNMRYEIVDGVLHFFVNYDFYVKRQPDGEEIYMKSLNSKLTVEE